MGLRRLIGVSAVGALLAWNAAATEVAHASTATAGFEVVRVSPGATSFDLFVTATTEESGSFIGELDAVAQHGHVLSVAPGGFTSQHRPGDGATLAGQQISSCGALGCGGSLQGVVFQDVNYSSTHSRDDVNLIFLVAEGGKIRYKFHGNGWRLRRTTLDHHIVEQASSGPASARVFGYSAAIFTGATAPGGSRGSIAEAMPPCSTAMVGTVSRGVGAFSLNGGTTTQTSICPVDTMPLAAYAAHKTTWSATGQVAGDSTIAECALFTIDLPVLPWTSQ